MQKYYLISILIIIIAMIPFFVRFEKRRLNARDITTLAVMCAVAVASRAAFVMLPNVKPMVGIIMIAGMSLGAEAGFLTGAMSGFVSNFIFGQGPWTPWQMFAYALAGFIAGIMVKLGILNPEKRGPAAIFGGLLVLVVIGPLLDTSVLFLAFGEGTPVSCAGAVYLAGLPVNIMHAAATAVTLFILLKPFSEIISRIKAKYGLME